MAKSVPVSRERHSGKGWRHPAGYGFVAADTIAPLGGSEFAHAAAAMPIAFIERSGHFLPVALLGLAKGSNVFVGPGGQWLGGYVPAVLRAYPFSLMRGEGSEQTFLCVDEDSGLIVDGDGETVEKFFEPDGSPSAMTNTLTDFLHSIEQDQIQTDLAVTALAEAGVIKPWPLTAPVGNQQVTVSGLYRVDEPALDALDDATFLKLRKASSLPVAYGQILSMGQAGVLSRLSAIRERVAQPAQAPTDLPLA